MNNESIKHIAKIVDQIATGQFAFMGIQGATGITALMKVDLSLLVASFVLYLILQFIVILILSELPD